MVLRLFSKSSTNSERTSAPKSGSEVEQTATEPATLAAAAEQAQSAKERLAIISRIEDAQTLHSLASAPGCLAPCADQLAAVESLEAALTLVSGAPTESQIEMTIGTHNKELRAAQISKFSTEEELVTLEHRSRSKNKACNRLARARLDKLRQARVTAAEAAALTQEFSSSAERLEHDTHLQARFDALAQKHAAAVQRHAESLAVLKEFAEQAPELVAMPAAPMTQAPSETDQGPDFGALSQAFSQLQTQLEQGTRANDLAQTMTRASADWQQAIAKATPDAKSIDAVTKCSTLYEAVRNNESLLAQRNQAIDGLLATLPELTAAQVAGLKRNEIPNAWIARKAALAEKDQITELLQGIRYPKGVSAPTVIEALVARRHALGELLDACKSVQTEIESDFLEQVKRLDKALDAGELKRAEAARGEARSLQDALPPGAANSSRKRFGALIGNMQNLRDWQHFATDPKREELCAQMQSIADNPKSPDEQAELVKELRAQWNGLGGKGPKEIATKFDEAAARAFEPCRLHYAQLAETRNKNLVTRKGILEQIEQFVASTDWQSADLNGARNILNSARKEWRDAFPVERSANKKLEKGFQVATDALYSKLQEGWAENLATKEQLVASAESLLASDDPLASRLDAAKELQRRWKEIGPVPRGPDQKLWKSFRMACDALFNTRDEQRNASQARYAADQTSANLRLDAFEKAIEETSATELERGLLGSVKRDLDEFEHLDRDVIKRARGLEAAFSAKLAQKSLAVKAQKLSQLKSLDVQAATSEQANQAVHDDVKSNNPIFAKRKDPRASAHLDLVLEAETQAGIESPASDSQRRMELQVLRLNAGMNSAARSARSGIELAEHWCSLKATAESEALRDRLFTAAQTLLASSSG